MICRVLNSTTIARQRRARAQLRAWRPSIRELCPAAHIGRTQSRSHTKKGPGRVSAARADAAMALKRLLAAIRRGER